MAKKTAAQIKKALLMARKKAKRRKTRKAKDNKTK